MIRRKKRQQWSAGDIFLIPLSDKTFSFGQVVQYAGEALNSVVCAFFGLKAKDEEEGKTLIVELNDSLLVAVLFTTRDLLDSGDWLIVENKHSIDISPYINLRKMESEGFIGVKVIGSGVVSKFLDAYFGLYPWDGFYKPDYLDNLLVSPEKKPKNIMLKKDHRESKRKQ
jgi:hypothetical protein